MRHISRRGLMKAAGSFGLVAPMSVSALGRPLTDRHPESTPSSRWNALDVGAPMMRDPVFVYDNWSAYGEGTGTHLDVRLTEDLALKQLRHLARIRDQGVHFDYYMMNAFWSDPTGGYRIWRKPDWPSGPDKWINGCLQSGLKPGLWFGSNSLWQMDLLPQWRDSLAVKDEAQWPMTSMSFSEGGFLADFMAVLQYWYDRGIRMFEFDVANFNAATSKQLKTLDPKEIKAANEQAFGEALKAFRGRNRDVMLVAFNDFGGDIETTATPFPFKDPVDLRWLGVFDTLYSGDVRPSDVPLTSFWRSMDIYNDHMVRRYEQAGVPLERIDPFFTLSTTWFGHSRRKRAWKSMLVSALARGSWKTTIYGELGLLNDDDARWFARAQRMYAPLRAMGRTKTFGGIPGELQPYGFGSFDGGGALYTIVNPAQEFRKVNLPQLSAYQSPRRSARVLFRDRGFTPVLDGDSVLLGPGQLVLVGFGRYVDAACDLGEENDVVIPVKIQRVDVEFAETGKNVIETTIPAAEAGDLRLIFQQRTNEGGVLRDRETLGKVTAIQAGNPLPVDTEVAPYEGVGIVGGISWSAGEIRSRSMNTRDPVKIRYSFDSSKLAVLSGAVYRVEY